MNNRRVMADCSSNNRITDLRAHWRDGHRVWMRKVTEGVDYVWREGAALATLWHCLGGITWHYAYLRARIPGREQADWFWQNAKGQVLHYDRVIADVEAQFESYPQWKRGEAAKCARDFAERLHELAPQVRGVVYGPPYFLRENAVKPIHGWALMVADYNGPVDLIPPGWKTWLAHQFTQSGRTVGISGNVDLSQLREGALRPGLHAGDRCFAVLDAKHLLRRAGYGGFLMSLGYGPGMRRAVRKFKVEHGCPNQDGASFGAWMWRHLS